MYKNYIFDLYGTLADIKTNEYTPGFWKKIAGLLACYDAFYTPNELKKAYQTTLKKTGPSFKCQHPEYDVVKTFQLILKQKGVSCPKSRALDIAYAFRVISRSKLCIYDGVHETLEMLKSHGKSVFLLSNAQSAFTMAELKQLGLDTFFDDIFLSSDFGVKKPDTLYYQMLLNKHSLNPDQCLMTGNDPEADILGAKMAGMDALYFHSNLSEGFTPPEIADYKVLDGDFLKVQKIFADFL